MEMCEWIRVCGDVWWNRVAGDVGGDVWVETCGWKCVSGDVWVETRGWRRVGGDV